MVKNRLFLFLFIFTFLFSSEIYSQVKMPDYAFVGDEIADFKIRPSYTFVKFDFKLPSKIDLYLAKQAEELSSDEKMDYSADEPGFMYKSTGSAKFASVFVGTKALRHNIVKSFLNKNYIDVLDGYNQFEKKLRKSEYALETKLLYGLSLFYTASHTEAIDVLTDVMNKEGEFSLIAQDSLFLITSELARYDIMEEVASQVHEFTEYGLSKWIEYLYSKDRFEDITKLLNNYPALEKDYTAYQNIRITCYYFLGRYEDIIKIANNIKDKSTFPIIIDTFIITGNINSAKDSLNNLSKDDVYYLLSSKIDLYENNVASASEKVSKINGDNEKLALLFYGAHYHLDKITYDFLQQFKFHDKINNDYLYLYIGIKYFYYKDYANAMLSFSKIGFNKELITLSYFYQGMAGVNQDTNRAEYNFKRFIDASNNPEKVMISKFMLAQIYYMRNQYDEAFMLIDDCSASYCDILKSEIFLALNDEKKAFSYVKNIEEDRARLIKANIYYNNKDYNAVINELKSIKTPSSDSNYLLMMSFFKEKRISDGENIIKNNLQDTNIFSDGLKQLILVGEGEKALSYMESLENIPNDLKIERAKLFLAYDKIDRAKADYNNLAISGDYLYESLGGLLEIAKKEENGKAFVDGKLSYIEKSGDFENKDIIISQLAMYAIEVESTNTAISYINFFISHYPESPYYGNILEARAKLFRSMGRFESCIADTDNIISLGSNNLEEALLMKAECMENIDKNKAMSVYRELAETSPRFLNVACEKIINTSNKPDDILWAAKAIQSSSNELWEKGYFRFLDLSDENDYNQNADFIKEMAETSAPNIRSASFWRIGKNDLDTGDLKDAVATFMKGYYLFPEEKYALNNLQGAKQTYTKRDMEKELKIIENMIKTHKK